MKYAPTYPETGWTEQLDCYIIRFPAVSAHIPLFLIQSKVFSADSICEHRRGSLCWRMDTLDRANPFPLESILTEAYA